MATLFYKTFNDTLWKNWTTPIKDELIKEEIEEQDVEMWDEIDAIWQYVWMEFEIGEMINYYSEKNIKCEWLYLYERVCPQNDIWCKNQKAYWFKKINWDFEDVDVVRLEPEYVIKYCKNMVNVF